MKDPYSVLGIASDASAEDIKKAYRRLARECHPDCDPGNPWAEQEFKELAAAYSLLANCERRADYDRGAIDASGRRRRARRPKPETEEANGEAASAHQSGFQVKGADVLYALTISLEDVVGGSTRHITLTSGKRLAVRVPPGADDGQTLRLKGEGMRGFGKERAGDALVQIRVRPHPVFAREQNDIRVELPVTLPEAVLGGKIDAPTLDGPVLVAVPAGSNTGTTLRLRGRGLPGGGGARGDQLVTLKVVLPRNPDPELLSFVKEWSLKHPYRVRRDPERPG